MIRADQLLRIPLAPVLLAQAIGVRRSARLLPEAAGPRQGTTGSGPDLRLLIAGDSSAAGVGVAAQAEALSGQLATCLSERFTVHWQVEATTGHRTRDALQRLADLETVRFDVVVTALGVNDVTRGTSARRFADQQNQLLDLLIERFKAKCVIVSGVPPMDLFPALPNPLSWVLGEQSRRLDAALADAVSRFPRAQHLQFQLPDDPEMAAQDGYHPSAEAYRLWAREIADRISM
ncbi:MAG: SGNH/GDSL hydrolase family protein [Rhodobacteraceae bacterium]|nr:SGNH/GDSL hydrolase family protein [Paracoccaceae bacterium]